jgi:PAP2 superfamily
MTMLVRKVLFGAVILSALGLVSFSLLSRNSRNPVSSQPADVVLFWNEVSFEAFGGTQYQHSLMASRINAMVHLAIHDALNGIEEKYSRYAFTGTDKKANPVATTAYAAHAILMHEIPSKQSFLDSALKVSLQSIKNDDSRARGAYLGKAAANAVISKRVNDGSASEVTAQIPVSNKPGIYQAVPPFDFVFAPKWADVKTFSLDRKDQFRSAPHPTLGSLEYALAFNEVKEIGMSQSNVRTPDQTAYAKFWYEFSEAGWNRISRTAVELKKLDMLEAARLFALVDMALADAYIAGWDSKFHYNFWRPYTAIHKADIDGNEVTESDKIWTSAEPTPPVHDYPSTHSSLGNAAATVLAKVLGDNTSFSFSSPTALPGTSVRGFKSFSQAANENASSRVMAGIHFRFSCEAGQQQGNKIGAWTVENHLRPLPPNK